MKHRYLSFLLCSVFDTRSSLVVFDIRHASESVFDTDPTPVLRYIFWTLEMSVYLVFVSVSVLHKFVLIIPPGAYAWHLLQILLKSEQYPHSFVKILASFSRSKCCTEFQKQQQHSPHHLLLENGSTSKQKNHLHQFPLSKGMQTKVFLPYVSCNEN